MKAEIKKLIHLTMASYYMKRYMNLLEKRIRIEKKMFEWAGKAGWENGKFEK